jgi:hypothetical protein
MNFPSIASNQQFKVAAMVMAVLSVVYIIINAFVIGGVDFIMGLNNDLPIPFAILIIVFSIMLWKQVGDSANSRFLWSHMITGWVCWAIAEILWVVFVVLGQDIPYPSWADFFWLIGYIPMGIGLVARVRSLPAKPTSGQQAVIWGISLVTVIFTVIFVLRPIIQNNDPERLLESILNLVYPTLDLFLLIIVLYLFFSYEQGAYSFGWRLLLVGFILHQVSNLLFSYASSSNLYYPDLQANWLSTLGIDVPYDLSYVFWPFGIYMLGILLKKHSTFKFKVQPNPVPNTHFLIFTKKDGTIIDVSHNFYSFFAVDDVKGKSLDSVIEFTEQEGSALREKIQLEKKLSDQLVHIKNRSGNFQDGWLCGIAIFSPQREYSGANYLIRTQVDDDNTLDNKLSESEKSVVRYFLAHNISNESNEIKQLLLDYYLAYIKSLFNMAFHEGGATMSQLLLDELQSTAQHYGWQIKFNPQNIFDGDAYPVDVLRNALPVFLETSKRFVSRITGPAFVDAQLQELHGQVGEAVHKNIERYGKLD